MKNRVKSGKICILSLALMGVFLMGCGADRQDTKQDIPQEAKQTIAAETMVETTKATSEATEETAQETKRYEDNFAVDSQAAKKFAQKVQDVTVKKDLEGLAELTSFPVYVGLPGVGGIETREDFLKLGADAVFTEILMKSVENADIDHFEPSMAGFSISDGGTANINFGVVNGVLAITGINY